MNKKEHTAAMAIAAALAIASPPVFAQSAPNAPPPVAVAIVDFGITKIDSKDPNVRIVQLNADRQQAFAGKIQMDSKYTHGDMVASMFVREYRKLEPTRPLIIYAVNPMRQDETGATTLNPKAIDAAMPALKAANVKIAVMAFGVSAPASGERIMRPFREIGVTMFAATPNKPNEPGIYPAASPDVISVGDEERKGYFTGTRSARQWVNFVASGVHPYEERASYVRGTSFAVAQVAAYGAFIADRQPGISVDGIRSTIAGQAEQVSFSQARRVGGYDMYRGFAQAVPVRPAVTLAPPTREAALSSAVQTQIDQMRNTQGR